MVAVEVRQGTLDMAARGRGLTARRRGRRKKEEGRRRETTDIESNNPHLTGEEKHHVSKNGLLANRFKKM